MIQVTRRELLKGAAALGAAATVPGALTPARAQTTQKRELVVAQGGDISKFDPHFSTSSNDIRVSFNIFAAFDRRTSVYERRRGFLERAFQ